MDKKPAAPKKQKKPQLVYKPLLTGTAASAFAAKRGLKLVGYQLIFVFLFLIVGSAMTFDSLALRIVTNGLLIAVCASLMYMEGTRQGETDAAFAEIAQARLDAGKQVDPSDKDRCFNKMKGWCTAAAGALPVVLIAAAYACVAKLSVYTLQSLPSWVTAYENTAEIGLPLSYYAVTPSFSIPDALRLVTRLLVYPYVNIVGTDNAQALLTMDRLSPLLVLIVPCFYGVGYMQGARLRAMVHGSIATNTRRRNRKLRKARGQQPKKSNQII